MIKRTLSKKIIAVFVMLMMLISSFASPSTFFALPEAFAAGNSNFTVSSDGYDITTRYVNETDAAVEGNFVLGAYNEEGRLLDIFVQPFSAAAGAAAQYTFTGIRIEDLFTAYCWDNNFVPLAKTISGFTYFDLVVGGNAADVYVDEDDYPGITHAAENLTEDIEQVTGVSATLKSSSAGLSKFAIIAGSIGNNPIIDELIDQGKLDVSEVEGKWEAYTQAFIPNPIPGVKLGLVIAGSDKRGTVFGIYSISDILGVSPWGYFSDAVPTHKDEVKIPCKTRVQGEPSVKYRGIFLNDERQNQVWLSYLYRNDLDYALLDNRAASVAIGHKFYDEIFDAILRMKGNYMWPIMWNNAFFSDDPIAAEHANEWGVVMGMSHHEFMSRPDKEWNWLTADRNWLENNIPGGIPEGASVPSGGLTWAYVDTDPASSTNRGWNTREVIHQFWRTGVEERKDLEQVLVLGLRGQNDTAALPGGSTMQDNVDLLRTVVANQRDILEDVYGDPAGPAQCIVLYNEVDIYYYAGYKDYVPDDVIVVLANDMHANTRSLPTEEDRDRPGGFGMYYHFDYNGSPRSTRFVSSIQPEKIREQMVQAYDYGVDKLWVVNVGNLKFYEAPTEYWMNLAYDIEKWGQLDAPAKFYKEFAEREFGSEFTDEAADVIFDYIQLNNCRWPEIVTGNTFSTTYFDEAQTLLAHSNDIRARAEDIYGRLPEYKKLQYYELVLFPVRMSNNIHRIMINLALNQKYYTAGMLPLSNYYGQLAQAERQFHIDEMNYWKTIKPQPQNNGAGKWTGYFPVNPPGNTPVLSEYTSRGYSVGGSTSSDNNIYYLGLTTWNHQSTLWNFATTGTTWTRLYNNTIQAGSEMIVAAEPYMGSTTYYTNATRRDVSIPPFTSVYDGEKHYFEVGNARDTAFTFNAAANEPWIVLDQSTGVVDDIVKVNVSIDWTKVPADVSGATGTVTVTSNAANGTLTPVTVNVTANVVSQDLLDTLPAKTYIEDDYGYVSILSKNFANSVAAPDGPKWTEIPNYGRSLSAVKVIPNVFDEPRVPGVNSPYLEYNVYIDTPGKIEVVTQWTPSMAPDFHKKFTKFQYGVSFGGDSVQTVNTVSANYRAHNTASANWSSAVEANSRTLVTGGNNNCYSVHEASSPGLYKLRIYLIDDNLVLQKIIIGTSKIPASERNTFSATSNDSQTLYCYPDTREMFSLLNGSEYPRGSGTIVRSVSGYREPANPNAVPRLLIGPTSGAVAPVSSFFGPPETYFTKSSGPYADLDWVGTWGAAQYYGDPAGMDAGVRDAGIVARDSLPNSTFRQMIRTSVGGRQLRLKFSNEFGTTPLTVNAVSIAKANGNPNTSNIDVLTNTPVTFDGGNVSVIIPPGEFATSDTIDFPVDPLERIAVSTYFGTLPTRVSCHVAARCSSYLQPGVNSILNETIPSNTNTNWFVLNNIDVLTPRENKSIVVIGDSITDGYGVSNETYTRWVDALMNNLQDNPDTRHLSVINMGIGTNSLLTGTNPIAARNRFARDVLNQPKVGYVVFQIGVNDLPGSGQVANNMIAAFDEMVKAAAAQGVKVIASTITPRGSSVTQDANRQTVNTWIREQYAAGNIYGLADFDELLRSEAGNTISTTYNNDGIHPNMAGYKAMGDYLYSLIVKDLADAA